jgi:SnoaL-like domain
MTTTHTGTSTGPDINTLAQAIEARDAETITALYAEHATLTLLDRDHPPSNPLVLSGRQEIGAYYRDICGRNMGHQVLDAVSGSSGLAYTQHCRYPDGTRVVCTTVATVEGGRITGQTGVQVWD